MMRPIVGIGLVLLVAGCQSRLRVDRTVHVEPGSILPVEIDPPRYDQKMSIAIESDAPVKVDVYLKRDAEAVEKDLTLKQKSDKTIGTWAGDKAGTLEINVPAHQFAVVRIEAEKKAANVTVKVDGR